MAKRRKVVLFLVEGESEKAALMRPFQALISAGTNSGISTESEAFYCDVTTARIFGSGGKFKVFPKVQNTIRQFVLDRIEMRHAYTWHDIARVVHIVDLDGAFIPESNIRQGNEPGYHYGPDYIEAPDIDDIVRRNKEKASALRELIGCEQLTWKRASIPYSVYFVSRNLEHALYGIDSDCSDDEKRDLSNSFADKYSYDPEGFAELLLSEVISVPGEDFGDTWDYAQQGTHSLERGSNLHLLVNKLSGCPEQAD